MRMDGIRPKKLILKKNISREKIDIACITESKLTEGENFSIPGYSVYRYNRNHPTASGGTAILIKRNIKHHEVYLPIPYQELRLLLSTCVCLHSQWGSYLHTKHLTIWSVQMIFKFFFPALWTSSYWVNSTAKTQSWDAEQTILKVTNFGIFHQTNPF